MVHEGRLAAWVNRWVGVARAAAVAAAVGGAWSACVPLAWGDPAGRSATGEPAFVDPFAESAAVVRPAVVAVGTYYFKDTPTVRYFGTGFVIHDGHTVVTNAHVVDAVREQNGIAHLRVFFPGDRPVDGREAGVWNQDNEHDLALVRFEGPGPQPLVLDSSQAPRPGQTVGVVGYPIGLKLGLVPAVHRGVVAAVVPAVLPLPTGVKMTPELAAALSQPYDLYQLDLVVYPGNSGSPLFDARNGRVIGIINKTLATKTREHLLDSPSGISYAVPSRWILELLHRSMLSSNAAGPGAGRDPVTLGD